MNRFLTVLLAVLFIAACEHNLSGHDGPPPPPGNILGKAKPFAILAGSTITCAPSGSVDGSIGVSPGSAITGFPPCTLTGEKHAADAEAAAAQRDLTVVFNYLNSLQCDETVTPADLGGRTLAPGVYCAASSLTITGVVTLDAQGDEDAVFVIVAGSTLGSSVGAEVKLVGGAQAKNVYWVAGSSATIGVSTQFKGTIIAHASITLNADVELCGRALARVGAVTIGTNVITLPD